jgi:hypothetical protein
MGKLESGRRGEGDAGPPVVGRVVRREPSGDQKIPISKAATTATAANKPATRSRPDLFHPRADGGGVICLPAKGGKSFSPTTVHYRRRHLCSDAPIGDHRHPGER